jgi:hypothetical protein
MRSYDSWISYGQLDEEAAGYFMVLYRHLPKTAEKKCEITAGMTGVLSVIRTCHLLIGELDATRSVKV